MNKFEISKPYQIENLLLHNIYLSLYILKEKEKNMDKNNSSTLDTKVDVNKKWVEDMLAQTFTKDNNK